MLTLKMLKDMPDSIVFATGIIPNSPEGVYMTDMRKGDNLRWVAKRGRIHDWVIYLDWEEKSLEEVMHNGQKTHDEKNIRKLVPCDDEAFSWYRM